MKKSFVGLFMLITILVMVACGNSGEKANGNTEVNKLEGSVLIDGSSTVYPIAEAVAEEFQGFAPDVRVSIGVSGTGGGLKAFIAETIDIANASRPMKDEEKQQLEEKNIEYTQFKIANDGISVVISKENDWVDYLTVEELKQLFIEDGTTKKWSDIRPEWPNEEVKLFSPGADSGTFDYFNEVILDDNQMNKTAMLSEDDNILVQGISGNKYALGYFGYAYFSENEDKLKAIPIDNGKGAITPTKETIESGEYAPFSRPLFIYVNNESLKTNEATYEYVKFTLENAAELADEVGYVRLIDTDYKEALQLLETLKK